MFFKLYISLHNRFRNISFDVTLRKEDLQDNIIYGILNKAVVITIRLYAIYCRLILFYYLHVLTGQRTYDRQVML
jgi:hypothetical protein